jgi:hypothetical protein
VSWFDAWTQRRRRQVALVTLLAGMGAAWLAGVLAAAFLPSGPTWWLGVGVTLLGCLALGFVTARHVARLWLTS